MKKILLTLVAVVALTSVASAQTKWTIGGTASFTSFTPGKDLDAVNAWSVMPKATYNFNETWGVGLGLGIGSPAEDVTSFSIEPSLTYTMDLGSNFYYTPSFYVGYTGFSGDAVEDSPAVFSVGINFGSFEFKPVEWMGITLSCGNLSYSFANEDAGEASHFNFGANSGQWSATGLAVSEAGVGFANVGGFAPTIGVRIHF